MITEKKQLRSAGGGKGGFTGEAVLFSSPMTSLSACSNSFPTPLTEIVSISLGARDPSFDFYKIKTTLFGLLEGVLVALLPLHLPPDSSPFPSCSPDPHRPTDSQPPDFLTVLMRFFA